MALTIAGHTHGGQIRLPMVPPVWAPSAYGARFAYGHIVENGRHMIVSGGLGSSKVPLRLGVPPEIVRIDWASCHSGTRAKASGPGIHPPQQTWVWIPGFADYVRAQE